MSEPADWAPSEGSEAPSVGLTKVVIIEYGN